jgi:two-component system, NtrC family, response regulator AtoC
MVTPNLLVLVVDGERTVREYLCSFLLARGYVVDTAASGEEAVARLGNGSRPSLIILDLVLPGLTGLEVLQHIRNTSVSIPVLILAPTEHTKTAIEAIKLGASEYVVKPIEDEELILSLKRIQDRQNFNQSRRKFPQARELDLVSCDPKVIKLRLIASRVADTNLPVIIVGESGVGKEVLARFIHNFGERRNKPFIKINCAAVPEELLESELFGYERGAFTGAISSNPGKFELAHKGTVLLDEIAEMSPRLQAKILHVLQDGEFRKLGGRKTVRVDTRVLAATNRQIEPLLTTGAFRRDLYFRLNVIKLEIPPLRERRDDIPLLANYFVEKYQGLKTPPVEGIPLEMMTAFLRYAWPGNVRQLENVIRNYMTLKDMGMVIDLLNDVSPQTERLPGNLKLHAYSNLAAVQAEKEIIARVLEETGWNRKEASRRLQVSYRGLRSKLKKWRMDKED